MTSPQNIREWLIKMEYSDPYPSEEALQILCKGPMGTIFQQIIDKVKPKAEVLHVKKSILVNRLINDNTNIYNLNDSHDMLELITYNEKLKLEKEFTELNKRNLEKEANLQHLISKLKSKNIILQQLKQQIEVKEKDIVLFKAKSTSLDKQIEVCTKLLEQLNILQPNTCEEDINVTLAEIEQVISQFDQRLSPPAPDLLGPITEEPFNSYLQTSFILSSFKKPLSISKRLQRANSTRKNIFDISNDFTLVSSTSSIQKKKKKSKICGNSFNNSSLSSNSSSETTSSVNTESLNDLEHNSWIISAVQNHVAEMWNFGPDYVLKLLIDLKIRHKKKIIDMIAENSTKVSDIDTRSKTNFACGMEKLYAHHIQTELKRMKCEQQQRKTAEMLQINLSSDNIQNIIILQGTEFGLQNSVSHLRENIAKMQQHFFDNTDQVEAVLNEIRIRETEIASTKSKLETNLCLLYACNAWLNKIQKQILENIKEPHSYLESQLLLTNTVEKEVNIFLSCPFQQNNVHIFDSWNEIYEKPELCEIFQCPFLLPDSSIKLHLNEKRWLNHLISAEERENEFDAVKIPLALHKTEALNNCFKKPLEAFKQAEDKCRQTLSSLNHLNLELKYNLTAPLNDCVAPKSFYEGKTLKEYVEMYDEYYNIL